MNNISLKKLPALFALISALSFALYAETGSGGSGAASGNKVTVIADEVSEEESIKRSPSFTDIVKVGDNYKRAETVSGIISERAGVQVKRYGGVGSASAISIRGSNPNQVMIYLDGMPLNDSRSGEVDLGNFPADNLARIDIYRGFTPVSFGVTGSGGVVNLVTKKSGKEPVSIASASYGSFDTSKITLSRSQSIDQFDYFVFFNRTGSDGDFIFTDDNGTPVVNTGDDREVKRENNRHVSYSGTVKGGYSFKYINFSLINDFFYKNQGLPGMYNNSAKHISFETTRNLAGIKAEAPELFTDWLRGSMNIFYSLKRDFFDNSKGEDLGLGGAFSQHGDFDTVGGDISGEAVLPALRQTIDLTLSYQNERYNSVEEGYFTDNGEIKTPEQSRNRLTAAAEDEFSFFSDTLLVVPQFRYEWWKNNFSGEGYLFSDTDAKTSNGGDNAGGKLGLKYFFISETLFAGGNAGTGYRAPSFSELFGERGYIIGNPGLKPEKSVNADIGGGVSFKRENDFIRLINFDYSFFYSEMSDIIVLNHNSQSTIKAQNLDSAVIYGHELSLSFFLTEHFNLNGNYTYQKALNSSSSPTYRGNYLPYRPVHEGSLSGKLEYQYAGLIYQFSYTGMNYRDKANSEFYYIDDRMIHNCGVEGYPYKGITLSFEVKNITDNRIRDVIGYPLPGRSYYVTLSGKL